MAPLTKSDIRERISRVINGLADSQHDMCPYGVPHESDAATVRAIEDLSILRDDITHEINGTHDDTQTDTVG